MINLRIARAMPFLFVALLAAGFAQIGLSQDTTLKFRKAAKLYPSVASETVLCEIPAGSSLIAFSTRPDGENLKIFSRDLPGSCSNYQSGWFRSYSAAIDLVTTGEPAPDGENPPRGDSSEGSYNAKLPVYGVWIADRWLGSESQMRQVISLAQAAGFNTLYPVAVRYTCAYFKSSVLPYCTQGGDRLKIFTSLVAQLAPEMAVIPWFERSLQVKYTFATERSDLIDAASTSADFPTLDLDLPEVRERIATPMSEVMQYPGVVGVHVDDGFEYHGENTDFKDNAFLYTRKLTLFVRDQISRFKTAHPTALFELSHLPQPFAKKAYLADWENWQFDRYIIQCYRSTAAAIINSRNCYNIVNYAQGRLSGIGVAGTANGVRLSDDDLIQVLRNQVSQRKSFVLFEAGELVARPNMVSRMKQIIP